MNLIQFLKETDQYAAQMSREQMLAFIHEYGRTLPEVHRNDFLSLLKAYTAADLSAVHSLQGNHTLQDKISNIKSQLEKIQTGEFFLDSYLNEEYDDWYDSSRDEFIFEDPHHIKNILSKTVQIIHDCIDQEEFDEAYVLSQILMSLKIHVEGAYMDYCNDILTLPEFSDYHPDTFPVNSLILDALYAAYKCSEPQKRILDIYQIICQWESEKITLEALMQHSAGELEDFPEFIRDFVAYIGKQNSKISQRLLKEAFSLLQDPDFILGAARQNVKTHPEIYIEILDKYSKMKLYKKGVEIGQEALTKIAPYKTIRAKAALITADHALKLCKTNIAQDCWLEAFRSHSTMTNYLRLAVESKDYVSYESTIVSIHTPPGNQKPFKTTPFFYTDNQENYMDRNIYFGIRFLEGHIKEVIAKAMAIKQGLGWSSTFMKQGLCLCLLFLYQGAVPSPAVHSILSKLCTSFSFVDQEYTQGTGLTNTGSEALFFRCFNVLKSRISPDSKQEQALQKKVEQWISLRVSSIMEANRRNYYNECAVYVAALGEVLESRGMKNARQNMLLTYKQNYPRRRAFHDELRRWGMKDR